MIERMIRIGMALLALQACYPATVAEPKLLTLADGKPVIVVLRNKSLRSLDEPLAAFASQVDANVWEIPFDDDVDEEELYLAASKKQPRLVVALGPQAAFSSLRRFKEVPILIAMVVNHSRLPQRQNVMGISLEVGAVAEFLQFKMVLPSMTRVLAMYVPSESDTLVRDAERDLKSLGIELVAAPVESEADVAMIYEARRRGVSAVWFLNDSVIMNPSTFKQLRSLTLRDGMPLLASLSGEFARAGALAAVSVDLNSLGGQAASMARQVVEDGRSPASLGFQSPIGATLVVNTNVAGAIGVNVPDDVLPFINTVQSSLKQH